MEFGININVVGMELINIIFFIINQQNSDNIFENLNVWVTY